MTGLIAIAAIVCFGAGVALIVLGWRGKRINDHPACRGCGFDLSNVLPRGVTCPECGAGLKRAKGVRYGQRRRRPIVLAVGVVLGVVPLALIGALALGVVAGVNLNAHKPFWMLAWQVRHGGAGSLGAEAELLDRHTVGSLSPDEEARILALALLVQHDHARPWNEAWGDLIESARLKNKLTEDETNAYLRDGVGELTLEMRSEAAPGDPLPANVLLSGARLGSGSGLLVQVWLDEATIGGKPTTQVTLPRASRFVHRTDGPALAVLRVVGSASGMRTQQEAKWFALKVPEGLAPGTYPVRLAVRTTSVESEPSTLGGNSWTYLNSPDHPTARRHELEGTVTIEGAPAPERVEPTPELDRAIAEVFETAHLFAGPHTWYANGRRDQIGISLNFMVTYAGHLDVPIACDVFIRSGGHEWKAGSYTSAEGPFSLVVPTGTFRVGDPIEVSNDFNADTVELVVRPNPDLVRYTKDQRSYYAGEIVVPGIQVRWSDRAARTPTPDPDEGKSKLERLGDFLKNLADEG